MAVAVMMIAVAVVVIETADHPEREVIGLGLGVGPEDVVAELVINRVDPLALGLVLPAALPVFRMDEVDLAVLVGFSSGLAPIDVLVPFDFREPEVVIAAERGDRPGKVRGSVLLKEEA